MYRNRLSYSKVSREHKVKTWSFGSAVGNKDKDTLYNGNKRQFKVNILFIRSVGKTTYLFCLRVALKLYDCLNNCNQLC